VRSAGNRTAKESEVQVALVHVSAVAGRGIDSDFDIKIDIGDLSHRNHIYTSSNDTHVGVDLDVSLPSHIEG